MSQPERIFKRVTHVAIEMSTHTEPTISADLLTISERLHQLLSKLEHAMSKNCSLGTHTHTTPDPDLFIQYDETTGPRGNSTVFIVQLEMNDVERYHTCKFSFALFMPGFNRHRRVYVYIPAPGRPPPGRRVCVCVCVYVCVCVCVCVISGLFKEFRHIIGE